MSFLEKDRCVAGAGYSRWMVPPAALCIHLCIGQVYALSVFNLPMTDSVLIEMPLKGSSGNGGGYNPRVTIWSGTTEAPDETAYGPWMELMGKAGLSWDQAITDYLFDGDHEVNRSGSRFFGGVSLRMNRPRPPEKKPEDTDESDDVAAPQRSSR